MITKIVWGHLYLLSCIACKMNVHMYVLYIIIINIQSLLEEAQIKRLAVYVVSSLLSQYITRGISHINIHHYVYNTQAHWNFRCVQVFYNSR